MKDKSRTPTSQQALTIEKPTLEDGIGSNVTVEINEKKSKCSVWNNNS